MEKEWLRKRLDDLRKEHGWSKCKLNEEAGFAAGMIYQWYNTERTPTVQNLEAICRACGITMREFFTDGAENIEEIRKTELFRLIDGLKPEQRAFVIQMIKLLKSLVE